MSNQEKPRWVDFTPEDTEYRLVMFEGGAGRQEIGLDRAEYEHLKSVLAKKRGYKPAEEDEASEETSTSSGADPLGEIKCIRKAHGRSDRRCSQFLIEEFQRDVEDFLESALPSEIAFMTSVFSLTATGGDLLGHIFRALDLDADEFFGSDEPAKEGTKS